MGFRRVPIQQFQFNAARHMASRSLAAVFQFNGYFGGFVDGHPFNVEGSGEYICAQLSFGGFLRPSCQLPGNEPQTDGGEAKKASKDDKNERVERNWVFASALPYGRKPLPQVLCIS